MNECGTNYSKFSHLQLSDSQQFFSLILEFFVFLSLETCHQLDMDDLLNFIVFHLNIFVNHISFMKIFRHTKSIPSLC